MSREEVAQSLKFVHASVESFYERVLQLCESEQPDAEDLARALLASKKIMNAAAEFRREEQTSKKPKRGLGYSKDDAMVVASLPWHGNNLSAAIRDHWNLAADDGAIRTHARRIRDRAQIEQVIGSDHPWETSANWLGDLIRE